MPHPLPPHTFISLRRAVQTKPNWIHANEQHYNLTDNENDNTEGISNLKYKVSELNKHIS